MTSGSLIGLRSPPGRAATEAGTGVGARTDADAGTAEGARLEPDKGQGAVPVAHTLIALTLCACFSFGIFHVFLPLFSHLSLNFPAYHLTSTVSLMKQKFRFYIFTKNWKAPQV